MKEWLESLTRLKRKVRTWQITDSPNHDDKENDIPDLADIPDFLEIVLLMDTRLE